jgi:hypothetical protein
MKALKLFALVPFTAVTAHSISRKECGNDFFDPPGSLLKLDEDLKSRRRSAVTDDARAIAASPLTVTTYFHFITQDANSFSQRINDTMVFQQAVIINSAYENTGFQFNASLFAWLTPNTTSGQNWIFGKDSSAVLEMKQYLRQGTYRDLNLYFLPNFTQGSSTDGLLGVCTYPALQNPKPQRSDYVADGCILDYNTVSLIFIIHEKHLTGLKATILASSQL